MDIEKIKKEIESELAQGNNKGYKELRNLYFYFYRHLNSDKVRVHYTEYNKKRRQSIGEK